MAKSAAKKQREARAKNRAQKVNRAKPGVRPEDLFDPFGGIGPGAGPAAASRGVPPSYAAPAAASAAASGGFRPVGGMGGVGPFGTPTPAAPSFANAGPRGGVNIGKLGVGAAKAGGGVLAALTGAGIPLAIALALLSVPDFLQGLGILDSDEMKLAKLQSRDRKASLLASGMLMAEDKKAEERREQRGVQERLINRMIASDEMDRLANRGMVSDAASMLPGMIPGQAEGEFAARLGAVRQALPSLGMDTPNLLMQAGMY